MRAHARGWCVCVCHGHALSCAVCGVCLRRLLRYPACDVGAACCELLPPRCYCLRIIPPPLTPPWSCVRRVAVRMHKCGAFGSHRTSPLEARMWRHSLWTSSCSSYNGLWKGSLPCSPSMLGRLGLASGASGGCTAAWRHRLDTTLGRPTKPGEPFLQVQYRTIGVIQYIMPLWEDCAGSLGLPRDMEGVARL